MNTSIHSDTSNSCFGARATGIILLSVLIAYILADVFLVSLLKVLQEQRGSFSLQEYTVNELAALRVVVLSILNPALALIVSLLLLRSYFPNEPIKRLLKRFGFAGRPSSKLLIASFAIGLAYVLLFTKGLMHFFPPDQFAAPHPDDVVNFAPLSGKLLFTFAVVAIAPIGEEFLFRGVLYAGLVQSSNKWIAGLLVSLVFIFVHPGTIGSGYWVTHAALYIFPFVLICVREITGTLFGSIMMHSGFNAGVIFF